MATEANGVRSQPPSVRAEPVEASASLHRASPSTLRQAQDRPSSGKTEISLFPYQTPEHIWLEHRESTRGRDLDITGLSYAMLDSHGPQQWPLREGDTTGQARLYEDGVFPTADGKARFAALPYVPLAEPRESRYPFSLTTGRLRDHWHGMTRTGTLGRLFGHVAEPCVQLHPQDMARRGLNEGDLVHVTSKRGSIVVPVQGSTELGHSQAFMAMHWGSEYLSGSSSTGVPLAGVNALTTSAHCPTSKQPELKHAAVKVLKANMPWTLLAMAWLHDETAIQARQGLRQLMTAFPFAACVPFGRERQGVLFRAAAHDTPDTVLLERIESLLGLDHDDALRYADQRLGQRRTVRLLRTGSATTLDGFVLAGDTRAEAWIRPLLEDALPAASYGRQLLMPGAKAPIAVAARSRQVCTCLDVSEDAINRELPRCTGDESERLAALQGSLQCGTQCGSCIPELRRLVRAVLPMPQAA